MQKSKKEPEKAQRSSESLKDFIYGQRAISVRLMFGICAIGVLYVILQIALVFCQRIDAFGDQESITTARTLLNNIGAFLAVLMFFALGIQEAIKSRRLANIKLVSITDMQDRVMTFSYGKRSLSELGVQMTIASANQLATATPSSGAPPGTEQLMLSENEQGAGAGDEEQSSPNSEELLEHVQEQAKPTAEEQASELQAKLDELEAAGKEAEEALATKTTEADDQSAEDGTSDGAGEKSNGNTAEDPENHEGFAEDDYEDDEEETAEPEHQKSIFGRALRWLSSIIKKEEEPQSPSFADFIKQREEKYEFWVPTTAGRQGKDELNVIEIGENTDLNAVLSDEANEEAEKLKQQIDEADTADHGADQGKLGNTQEIVQTIEQSMRQAAEEESLNNDLINCEQQIGGDVQGILEQAAGQQQLIDQINAINRQAENAQMEPSDDEQLWQFALAHLNVALAGAGFDPLDFNEAEHNEAAEILQRALKRYVGDSTVAGEILAKLQVKMSQPNGSPDLHPVAEQPRLTLDQVCSKYGARITMMQSAPVIDYPAMVAFKLDQAVAMDDEEQKMLAIAHNFGLLPPELDCALDMAGLTVAEVKGPAEIDLLWMYARQAIIDAGLRSEDVADRCLAPKRANITGMRRLRSVNDDKPKAVVHQFPGLSARPGDTGQLNYFGRRQG